MKQYKVESLVFYGSFSKTMKGGREHLKESSRDEIQEVLNHYAKEGYRLVSTDSESFGSGMYVYLYFEKDV